jgi:hypothetical protein
MKYFGKNILHHDLEFKKGNVSGSVESSGSFGRIDSTTLSISEIKGNFTNAGNTIADLGAVTTVDINGGSIDGTSIGTNDAITQLTVDNVDINGNTINATSGDLTLTADGGDILIDNENVVGTGTIKNFVSVSGSITSTGSFGHIESAGDFLPKTDNVVDLGSSARRWANLFVGDLVLSNEGSGGNEIDGTEGNWIVQEGEENLYLLNKKNGKKYKFKLEEVD